MSDPPAPLRRFLPEPVETTTKTNRKFNVEPVEECSRSNSKKQSHGIEAVDFAKQPEQPPKRRFLPQPVETTVTSNRKSANRPAPELTPEPSPKEPTVSSSHSPPPVRKFAPQLIETSIRSKRRGQNAPATLPTDKTDITPGTNHIYQPRRKLKRPPVLPFAPENTPVSSTENVKRVPPRAPRREGSMRPHTNTRRSTRSNSYVPALQPIASEGSTTEENSGAESDGEYDDEADYEMTPSLSGSMGSSEDSIQRLQLARTRESCDDRFSGYLLELAAKAAEKQLREQALAAFPNSDFHDPVEHFYDREIDLPSDDESVAIGLLPHEILERRKSTEVGWAQKEMQDHLEQLARNREDDTMQRVADEATAPSFKDPFWTNGMTAKGPVDRVKEAELEKMRSAASPPMLGDKLKFRMCPSPKATMFETDQRFDVKPAHRENGGGLWGGYCVADEEEQYLSPTPLKGPQMMQTPQVERDDPFASAFSSELPNTTKKSKSSIGKKSGLQMISGIDDRLKADAKKSKLESSIQDEFDDDFVTQVFNYLSLGYPSLARLYDEEISKITKVAESELSKDDKKGSAQGHLGTAESKGTKLSGAEAGEAVSKNKDGLVNGGGGGDQHCARWHALRLYIVEWARQNPSMEDSAIGPAAWGVRARRGSWAI